MAELGCDHPEVNLKLDRKQIPAGETLSGSFLFWREFMERADNTINVEFVLRAQLDDEVIEQKIDEFPSGKAWISEESEIVEFPFVYRLPKWLPVSTHAIRYYVRPKIELFSAAEHTVEDVLDMEAILIQPNKDQLKLIKALDQLGFHENLDSRFWNGNVQEFDFSAAKETELGVRELTVLFAPIDGNVQVHLCADQREPVSFRLSEQQDIMAALKEALSLR